MADLEGQVFDHEWNLPRDSPLGMILYGMTQELATWLNYRNLRHRVDETGDPALSRLLGYIMVDERCHHDFYKRIAQLYLEQDRAGTLEELRRVVQSFAMPALHMLADSRQRVAEVKALRIFDEEIFFRDVLRPLLDALGVEWSEFRQRSPAAQVLADPVNHANRSRVAVRQGSGRRRVAKVEKNGPPRARAVVYYPLRSPGKGGTRLDLVLTTYGKLIALVALAVATPLSLLVKLTGLLWRRK